VRRSEHVSKGLRTASPRCGGVVATRLENLLFPLFFCLSAALSRQLCGAHIESQVWPCVMPLRPHCATLR
jgi:hypothetical protein